MGLGHGFGYFYLGVCLHDCRNGEEGVFRHHRQIFRSDGRPDLTRSLQEHYDCNQLDHEKCSAEHVGFGIPKFVVSGGKHRGHAEVAVNQIVLLA